MPIRLTTDYLIIGAGIIGLTLAYQIKQKQPTASITIIEKEDAVARHASGRNSGVLHAGFYYTADSLKAKFTRQGNLKMRQFCKDFNIPVLNCPKVVVAQDEMDVGGIHELYRRGQNNNVPVQCVNVKELAEIEPNAKTTEIALYSPSTASVSPQAVCKKLHELLAAQGVRFLFKEGYQKRIASSLIQTKQYQIEAKKIINAAGLYADKIAKDFGLADDYTIIPFKGIYLKYDLADHPIKTHIYPVPNLNNPFLGVHFTLSFDGHIKIGPTAIPAFWRENYAGLSRFNFRECKEIISKEARLFWHNNFQFRSLAFHELRKYQKSHMIKSALKMVHTMNPKGFQHWSTPGIRAQLLNTKTQNLVQDFLIETRENSIHILNAVSPAFTCSFAFSEWVIAQYL